MARIFVSTYAKYNEGSISGEWMDPGDYTGEGDFLEACTELHKDEVDPELMFLDWEDCFGMVEESSIDPALWDVLEFIARDEVAPEAVQAFLDNGYDWDEDEFEDAYCGDYSHTSNPRLAYTEELVEDCYNLEGKMGDLARYFDYAAFARDLFIEGYWEEGGHIFRNI